MELGQTIIRKKCKEKDRSHRKKKKVQRIRFFLQNHSSGLPRSCYVQRLPLGGRIMIYNADYLQSLLLRGVVEILVLSLKETNFNVLMAFENVIITIIIVIIE